VSSHARLSSRLTQWVGKGPVSRPLPWRVCHAARALMGADGASITLENTTPGRVTLCATDRRSEQLEDLQDVLGEGPYLSAFATGQTATAWLGGRAAARWPRFATAARGILGPAAVLWSVPMRPGGHTVGTLSLYRLAHEPLAEPLDDAQPMADTAGAMLLTDPQAFLEAPQGGGWSSRSVVHQATGMLMAKLGISADGALALLRGYAFNHGTELRQVATAVVSHKLDLSTL
jgi:ANTAR domain-containing protein